jgi:hypothetical protein
MPRSVRTPGPASDDLAGLPASNVESSAGLGAAPAGPSSTRGTALAAPTPDGPGPLRGLAALLMTLAEQEQAEQGKDAAGD